MQEFSFFQPPSTTGANFKLLSKLATGGAKVGKGGFWEKAGPIMEAVGIATLPLSLAPSFIESADTRALKTMRNEERIRQAKGLAPLPVTDTVADKLKDLK